MAWPTWTLDTARVRSQLKDGEVKPVSLSWSDERPVNVWCGRAGDTILAASAVGHASDQEIATWIRARLAEAAKKAKQPRPAPPQPNLIEDIFRP